MKASVATKGRFISPRGVRLVALIRLKINEDENENENEDENRDADADENENHEECHFEHSEKSRAGTIKTFS